MSEIFMVYVQGTKRPRKVHATLESATTEAERLAAQPFLAGRKVFILSDVGVRFADARVEVVAAPAEEKRSVLRLNKKSLQDSLA